MSWKSHGIRGNLKSWKDYCLCGLWFLGYPDWAPDKEEQDRRIADGNIEF